MAPNPCPGVLAVALSVLFLSCIFVCSSCVRTESNNELTYPLRSIPKLRERQHTHDIAACTESTLPRFLHDRKWHDGLGGPLFGRAIPVVARSNWHPAGMSFVFPRTGIWNRNHTTNLSTRRPIASSPFFGSSKSPLRALPVEMSDVKVASSMFTSPGTMLS